MREVSLDEFRSEGVSVFGGHRRGVAVAEAITDKHGPDIEIRVPDDVIYVGSHFKAGFHEILPNTKIPNAND